MKLSIDHYSKLNLKYNPFSFLNEEEQLQSVILRFQMEELVKKIEDSKSIFVEFYGKKGHGKSTHLSFLINRYFPNADYIKLQKNNSSVVSITENILVIDSFQLLTLKNRLNLLRKQKKLITSSHNSHRFGIGFIKDKCYEYVNFNKLELEFEMLKSIINSKIEIAILNKEQPIPKIKDSYLQSLKKKYNKDLRAMQMNLYTEFLNLNSKNYEI